MSKNDKLDLTQKELLIRIDERVERLQIDFGKICARTSILEDRMDRMEQWKSYVLGAVGIIAAIFGILGNKIIDYVTN